MYTINNTMERALHKQAEELLEQKTLSLAIRISEFLSPTKRMVELLVRSADIGELDISKSLTLERRLFSILQASPQITGIHFGRPDGSLVFVFRPTGSADLTTLTKDDTGQDIVRMQRDEGFKPLSRRVDPDDADDQSSPEWYKAASDNADGVWTDAHRLRETGQYGLTFAKPVLQDGVVIGVFAVDTEISLLAKSYIRDSLGNSQVSMIMNRAGDMIAYSDGIRFFEDIPSGRVAEIGDAIAADAFTQDLATNSPVLSTAVQVGGANDGALHLTIIQPLNYATLPWLVALHASEESLTGGLQANRSRIPLIILATFAVTSLLAIPIAGRIIRPIVRFSSQSETASSEGVAQGRSIEAPYSELSLTGKALSREILQRKAFQTAYQRTFEVSSRGMARIDPSSYQFLHVNKRLCELLGRPEDQLLDKNLWQLVDNRFHRALESFRNAIMNDREFTVDASFRAIDDKKIWLRMSALLIRNHLGAPDHALVILDDIASERSAEERLDQLKRDLYHLGRVNMMGQFAEGLAHELNQPLGAIVHDLDSAKHSLKRAEINKAELSGILNDIDRHAHRAGAIIRALRNLIRKDEDKRETFDLTDLLEQTRNLMDAEARHNGVLLSFQSESEYLVHGNRSQLAQVLVNLIRNAFEAIAPTDSSDGQVRVSAIANGDRIQVCVEDNGPGLPPRKKPFTKFETTRPEGLGLGLSICKSLVEANGGTIRYEQVQPTGARFVIDLNGRLNHEPGARDG